jgi:type IV fimbrial biogenesis protein FimT
MMVALALLGILAAMAMPSFADFIARQRAKNAASDLFTSLLRARSEAIKRNGSMIIAPKAGNWAQGWTVVQVATTQAPMDDHEAMAGLTISGPPTLVYRSSGRLSATDPVQFQVAPVSVDGATHCVEIDLSGRPLIRKSAC